jgi:hypothetical protein
MAGREPLILDREDLHEPPPGSMSHRRADVRAAVFKRQRSQGHLRAVTATVGAAGVVTAGVVAAILPGSTHASASPRTVATPAPSPPASVSSSPASAATGGTSGTSPARHYHRRRHHHRHASAPAPTPAATTAPAAPVPTPAATTAPPQGVSGGS